MDWTETTKLYGVPQMQYIPPNKSKNSIEDKISKAEYISIEEHKNLSKTPSHFENHRKDPKNYKCALPVHHKNQEIDLLVNVLSKYIVSMYYI